MTIILRVVDTAPHGARYQLSCFGTTTVSTISAEDAEDAEDLRCADKVRADLKAGRSRLVTGDELKARLKLMRG